MVSMSPWETTANYFMGHRGQMFMKGCRKMQAVNTSETVAVIKGYTQHIDWTGLKRCVGRRMHTNVSTLHCGPPLYLEHAAEADYKQWS